MRVGTEAETAGALTRSRLADGRVVGWYGAPGTVVDAEVRDVRPPARLGERFGTDDFWSRWTRAECAAKLFDVPMHLWLRRHGLSATGAEIVTFEVADLVVSVARRVR